MEAFTGRSFRQQPALQGPLFSFSKKIPFWKSRLVECLYPPDCVPSIMLGRFWVCNDGKCRFCRHQLQRDASGGLRAGTSTALRAFCCVGLLRLFRYQLLEKLFAMIFEGYGKGVAELDKRKVHRARYCAVYKVTFLGGYWLYASEDCMHARHNEVKVRRNGAPCRNENDDGLNSLCF